MNILKKLGTSLFGISRRELTGFRLLIVTSTSCLLFVWMLNYFTKQPYSNYEKDAKSLDSLLALMDKSLSNEHIYNTPISYSYFDPNDATKEELVKNAFPEWLANRVINYRSKGGVFNSPNDLLKIYGFPDSLYFKVSSYILIKPIKKKEFITLNNRAHEKLPAREEEELLQLFNINEADTSVLKTVKGIGSVYSKRIIKYRQGLGGFVDLAQLYDIYNLDSATIEFLFQTSFIEEGFEPKYIFVNSWDEKQLAASPLISWKQAKLITAYRNQHGNFSSKDDLMNVYLLNEAWYKKIAPYLAF